MPSDILATALTRQSCVYRNQCAWQEALTAARRGAQVAIGAELPELFAEALNAEALVYMSRGDLAAAEPLLRQVIVSAMDDRILGNAYQNLGQAAAQVKDFESARVHLRKSRHHFRRAGYRRGEAIALNNQAAIANLTGDHAAALATAKEALSAARDIGDFDLLATASLNQAEALVGFERFADAECLASQALGFYGIEANVYRQVQCLRLLGDISRREAHTANAIRCYERALKLAEGIDAQAERALLEDRLAELEGTTAA